MEGRRAARERALELLYEADTKGSTAGEVIDGLPVAPDQYAIRLVTGVDEHRPEIDELISQYAKGWALDRMPAVDRALLRIGTYELSWGDGLTPGVVINEAVELAQQYSTKDSGRFVNGLLSRVAEHVQDHAS